ncbi:MAG: hypothetical protein J2P27_17920, partial [Actinobacteria bacterium]|nr:hypothetical protein [Actinomycetota bacterium]
HASTEDLASLAVGDLRPRRAAKLRAHLSTCEQCTTTRQQLDEVPVILASAAYPPMPDSLTVRIEAAIHTEVRERVAAAPATESGRRDLPAHRRRRVQPQRAGGRLSGLQVSRLVAAAATVAVVVVGGYEIATHAGSPSSGGASSTAGRARASASGALRMSPGPEVTYGRPGALHTIHAVRSGTNFLPGSLAAQAAAAVHAARAHGVPATPRSSGSYGPSRSNVAAGPASPPGPGASESGLAGQLAGCLNLIAPGRMAVLLDIARFQGKPATLIVVAATSTSPAEAWMVGASCSATVSDILAHAPVAHL